MTANETPAPDTVVIGAGPAGLTAAWELRKLGHSAVIFEADDIVGGISRTVTHEGFRFDIGGHRFFTKLTEVQAIWEEILGDDLLERPRLSRIFYDDHFFDYPLRPVNALRGLGLWNAVRVAASYARVQIAPHKEEKNFEQWVTNRFGTRLYEIFFKTYTEKVWGMPCNEISADWASQRIKNLDLVKAVRNALLPAGGSGEVITTLIERFLYPRHGPGMMWERCQELLKEAGTETHLSSPVVRLHHEGDRVRTATVRSPDGSQRQVGAENFISSMPLGHLVRALDPPAPPEILAAADRLRYRDFLTVVLIIDRAETFPDNWIYIHSPKVTVGRVQNFKNWSPEMVPNPEQTALGLEYFVHEGDEVWSSSDADLLELGKREMAELGLVDPKEVIGGTVVRMPKAYPVYDDIYKETVATLRAYLEGFKNLQAIGRNGQHRYNNQDHSMMAALLAARNIAGARNDVWDVNTEPDYHEEDSTKGDRLTPKKAAISSFEDEVREIFARYDPIALGVAFGTVLGTGIYLATALLLLRGGNTVGANLSLLGNYFVGFNATWTGALLGGIEGAIGGFALGYLLASGINRMVGAVENTLKRRLQTASLDPLDAGPPE